MGFFPHVGEEDNIHTSLYRVRARGGGKGKLSQIKLGQWFLPGSVSDQKFALYFALSE